MSRKKTRAVNDEATALFSSLAEQVRVPFLQITHISELAHIKDDPIELKRLFNEIGISSKAALRLIDGYLLSLHLKQQQVLELEPISIGSVFYDVAQQVDDYAKSHDCDIRLNIKGKNLPVMAQREAVESALINLGYSFIDAIASSDKKVTITLGSGKNSAGVSAGVFSDSSELTAELFKKAKLLKGVAKQPLGLFTAGSGAGVFVADSLFEALGRQLKVAKMQSQKGLAVNLDPSHQLAII